MGTPPESPRRSNASTSSSPEFQFWVDVNSSNANNSRKPQPSLHSADELFSGGILLPLHTVLRDADEDIQTPPSSSSSSSSSIPSPALSSPPPFSLSRNWKDLFKPSGDTHSTTKKQPPEKKSTSTAGTGTGGGPAAELNIHLWPFSRSRSAGTAAAGGGGGGGRLRKSSSAPCSRSNSRGESSKPAVAATATAAAAAPKRWGPIPGRAAGFRLGRSSPVWQFRRGNRGAAEAKEVKEKCGGGAGAGGGDTNGKKVGIGRGLNLNVNTCIRYRNPLVSCRGYEKVGVAAANDARNVEGGGGVEDGGGGGASGGLFNIRSIFSKKVY